MATKGPSVELPLGTAAPVFPASQTGNSEFSAWVTAGDPQNLYRNSYISPVGTDYSNLVSNTGSLDANGRSVSTYPPNTWDSTKRSPMRLQTQDRIYDQPTALWTDLTDATAATINQLREAFQIQKLYERDARGGTRYVEILRSHFGVISSDARLQRPEYLGGGNSYVNINPIAQTSATDSTSPQGNLAAMGTMTGRGIGFQKSFEEHGYVIGLVSARADLSYQYGVNRLWNRKTRFDFYWPSLAHLGEQAVLNSELYVSGTTNDQKVFGYQERYAEYRYKPSEIIGDFASNAPQSLDIWHLAQKFTAAPALNASFIESTTPIDRIIAVPTEPHFLWDGWFKYITARPMPTYSVPGLVDHF